MERNLEAVLERVMAAAGSTVAVTISTEWHVGPLASISYCFSTATLAVCSQDASVRN